MLVLENLGYTDLIERHSEKLEEVVELPLIFDASKLSTEKLYQLIAGKILL